MKEFLGIVVLAILALIIERVGVLATLKSIGNLALVAIFGCFAFAVIRTFLTAESGYRILIIALAVVGLGKLWDKVTDWYWNYPLNHPADEPAPTAADAENKEEACTSAAQAKQKSAKQTSRPHALGQTD